jgi:hypothetical protein
MLSSLFSKIPIANHVEVALQTKAISSSSLLYVLLWFLLPIYTTTLLLSWTQSLTLRNLHGRYCEVKVFGRRLDSLLIHWCRTTITTGALSLSPFKLEIRLLQFVVVTGFDLQSLARATGVAKERGSGTLNALAR